MRFADAASTVLAPTKMTEEGRAAAMAALDTLEPGAAQFTTQFTCFTSTKVQILTPAEVGGRRRHQHLGWLS